MQQILTKAAPYAVGPFSQAIVHDNLLFCSGQLALDAATMMMVGTTIEEQARLALKNMQTILRAANLDFADVLKTTVFLKDMGDFQRMNSVYEETFSEPRPARTTVEVARLPLDALVEVECIARFPSTSNE